MTKSNLALIEAFNKGYRASDGQIFFGNNVRSLFKNSHGYSRFTIRFLDKVVSVAVHRLVAYQKYGEAIFESGIEVRHLDSDKTNNLDYNIGIGTHSQNMMDKSPEIRRAAAIKASQSIAKFDHSEIITFHRHTKSYKKTMSEFGISSKGTLNFILRKSMAQETL